MPALNTTPLRFLVSGGSATAVHLGVMGLLIALHIDARIATAAGALLGAATNYWLQYLWTFGSQREHRKAMAAFFLVSAVNWLLNLALFSALYQLASLSALPAQVITTCALTLLNYRLYGKLVFT